MAAEKLTKKQLKAANFRKKGKTADDVDVVDSAAVVTAEEEDASRSSDKGKVKEEASTEATHGDESKKRKAKVKPEQSDGVVEAMTVDSAEPSTSSAAEKRERKERKRKEREAKERAAKEGGKVSTTSTDAELQSKKRKRSDDKAGEAKKVKKRFTEDGQVEEVAVEGDVGEKGGEEEQKDDKRYIIFVGNMSFQSTPEQIANHFASHCAEVPSVRLLTKRGDASKLAQLSKSKQKSIAKGKAADPSAPVSKGCAFLEFKGASALQKALQFHHTQFQGRNINVELTAGGGGASAGRKEKIRKKNQDLETERQKLHEKYVKNSKKDKADGEGAKEAAESKKKKEDEPAVPHWGPRAAAGATAKGRSATKVPRWAASGANAVRLSG